MIKFFRRIRQRLLSESNFRKYMLYAVGEIILVVVGILIALQVNNWNEERKLRKYERIALEKLQEDLQSNMTDVGFCIDYDIANVKSIEIILDHLENRRSYHDSLRGHFAEIIEYCAYSTSRSAYENIKSSKGLDLISDESLRAGIIDLYESTYYFATENIGKEEAILNQELILPLFADLFVISGEKDEAVPVNYEALFNHQRLVNVLHLARHRRLSSIRTDKRFREKISGIIDQITVFLNGN